MSPVPLEFAQSKVTLNWADLMWAYERALLTWKDLVRVASESVAKGSTDILEYQLSCVDKESVWKVRDLANELSKAQSATGVDSEKKWLFLELSWAYENRKNIPDPLGLVEEIYADFGYPSEIESFVRYMPVVDGYDPVSHTLEENNRRLFENWRRFLDVQSQILMVHSRS
jgi:hypothetical protein